MNQENTRTKLQQKIAADLAEKAKNKPATTDQSRPDGVDDSAYLKDTKSTTSLAWLWAIIFVAIAVIVVWLVVESL